MTYPPQPPGPYGQPSSGGFPGQRPGGRPGQQPGGYPQQQPGGFGPQQPGGYPQHQGGGYGHQQPPPGGYGDPPQQGFPGGPPPPPKKKTGLIIGIVAAVLLLLGGAVAFTGFVAPGFFVSSDEDKIEEVGQTVVDGLTKRDASVVKPVSCNPEAEKQADFDQIADGTTWEFVGPVKITGKKATAPIKQKDSGGERTRTLSFETKDGTWCASRLD